jgi:hypothetical protein
MKITIAGFGVLALLATVPAKADSCHGITPADVRQSATERPLRMSGIAAKPEGVSELRAGDLCVVEMILSFGNSGYGYKFSFIVTGTPGDVSLQPLYNIHGNPPPIQIFH